MPFGAQLRAGGAVRFRLWSPPHAAISLELDGGPDLLPMQALGAGWFELTTARARAGSRYRFVLPDGSRVPDPASRFQPDDVHAASQVIDPQSHAWRDTGWRGRPWEEAVLYELHVGTFTPEGTFRSAIDRLDHLVELGVTAVELMPIGDFPGKRNWGYDGVLPYAPDSSYGRPDDLKALVEAAHERGLMILLDVVYNHFGPDGAYIHSIAPQTFTDRHQTPWGAAINTDGPEAGPVRAFFVHNALYWIEEFNFDGLRLDAVHAILDDGPKHLLDELAEQVREAVGHRPVHLVLENEENAAHRLVRRADGRPRWYTAQWNDDVHHVLHAAATGEKTGYYADYRGDTAKLGRALSEGFAFQGEVMPYRGSARGESTAGLPPGAFVAFIQNHDQVGNRAFGERLPAIAPDQAVRAAAATYLLLPQIPMLFMGEEWAAAQPFPFFCDFGPELGDAVRQGRRDEFARFPEFQDPASRERIPDPTAEATFLSAKLAWADLEREPHAGRLAWYRRLLQVRREEIVPVASRIGAGRFEVLGPGAVAVRWPLGERGEALVLQANLSATPISGFTAEGRCLWLEGEVGGEGAFAPFTVRWSLVPGDGPARQAGEEQTPLDRLAERMGVEAEFRDARGEIVRAAPETKRRILEAMALDPSDEQRAGEILSGLEADSWREVLPPVRVVRADRGPATIELVLPAGSGAVAWRVGLEDGGELEGTTVFDRLVLLDSHRLDGRSMERRCLVLPDPLPWGYHRLEVGSAAASLIVSPGRCWLPPELAEGGRLWGIAAQLYLLRSATDWGIGDYGDLQGLVGLAASHGADVVGLNPLHAMFPDDPEHASPYSPASRLLLNVLNIDVTAVPELWDSPAARARIGADPFRRTLEACRASPLVDYAKVAELKLDTLWLLFSTCHGAADRSRWQAFEAFRDERGELLERNCRFLALREHFAAISPDLADWHAWPEPYRDPSSAAVDRFAAEQAERIAFLAWLQWIAEEQLSAAAAVAARRGMRIGLYRDLAVGADRAGAETWINAAAVVSGAQVGAPPDIHNPAGQDWGLPPFNPDALRREGYRSFIELVRANMQFAGGLRIDHVMGLQHLYWVPCGRKPAEGAYVSYPREDLIGILALESHRQRCLVVGEDLGTVPEGFRQRPRIVPRLQRLGQLRRG